jgi:uracil-DNA glycosylase
MTPLILGTFGADVADEGWRAVVQTWSSSEKGAACLRRVAERRAIVPVYPAEDSILAALRTPLRDVKVVLLGQDPYHGASQAHGLSFSVREGVPLPPSLKNIRKELISDLGRGEDVWPAAQGSLTSWANQGVLLLNSVLTVDEGNPASHAGFGWEELTQQLLGAVVAAHAEDPLVFLAWGKVAQTAIYKLHLGPKHRILADVHPSPLSAYHGFFGSKPFTRANAHLEILGAPPINWTLHVSQSEDPVEL